MMNAKNAAKQPKPVYKPETRIFFHRDTPKAIVEKAAAEVFAKIGADRRARREAAQAAAASTDAYVPDYCI